MNDKEMFENWMKKKEEIQSRIERTDKMVKDREEEITLLENQISYLEETIDSFMDEPDIVIKKLQSENAELQGQLKSCIFVYEEKVDRLINHDIAGYKEGIDCLELRISQADKIIKDRQDELNYLVNKVEELEKKLKIAINED